MTDRMLSEQPTECVGMRTLVADQAVGNTLVANRAQEPADRKCAHRGRSEVR